ncbi:DNA-binding PadR family transcriptional regulator [Streptosporangium album]|uniref:DNA-binding PadR family transcriptional regulator n=1 Tax=Streptosporangium album TaxID=47479 RepID=A0A7W7WDV2_9ACTN|nr:PadR family transcriptional regulator [Streptosporangium album]MBB4943243.1 DNA-binding PadR family transcriptional regulator [Streptosporangium album]
MSPRTPAKRSSLGLIVLGMLTEESMHVYRMQKLIEQYGKTRVVNVRSRFSLYQMVERLERLGLVEACQTESTESHPDRIIYAITDAGRETAVQWLREMLSTTGGQSSEFIAAVSVLVGLTPDDARTQLELRAANLAAGLADTEAQLAAGPDLPRLFLLEEEYRKTVLTAELGWVRSVIEDLRMGRLTWDEQWRRGISAQFTPCEEENDK